MKLSKAQSLLRILKKKPLLLRLKWLCGARCAMQIEHQVDASTFRRQSWTDAMMDTRRFERLFYCRYLLQPYCFNSIASSKLLTQYFSSARCSHAALIQSIDGRLWGTWFRRLWPFHRRPKLRSASDPRWPVWRSASRAAKIGIWS